jgi:hypothetical protein
MKKFLTASLVIWAMWASAPRATFAESKVIHEPHWRQWHQLRGERLTDVPELDGAAAGQALALLVGASVLVLDRARRKRT